MLKRLSRHQIIVLSCLSFVCVSQNAMAQVGIGTQTPEAMLHVVGEPEGTGLDVRIDHLDSGDITAGGALLFADQQGYLKTTPLTALTPQGDVMAGDVLFDNQAGDLTAQNVQDAIDEILQRLDSPPLTAADISYNDILPGLGGGTVQDAIDLLSARLSQGAHDQDWLTPTNTVPMDIGQTIYTMGRVGIGVQVPAFELDVTGDIRVTGNLFAGNQMITHNSFVTSDRRLKEDIKPLDVGLKEILSLEPVSFRYRTSPLLQTKAQEFYGFIAQDAAKVDKNLVASLTLPKALMDQLDLHVDEPATLPQAPTVLGIDTHRIPIMLVKAFQELYSQNQQLTAQNKALEQRLGALEAFLLTQK